MVSTRSVMRSSRRATASARAGVGRRRGVGGGALRELGDEPAAEALETVAAAGPRRRGARVGGGDGEEHVACPPGAEVGHRGEAGVGAGLGEGGRAPDR